MTSLLLRMLSLKMMKKLMSLLRRLRRESQLAARVPLALRRVLVRRRLRPLRLRLTLSTTMLPLPLLQLRRHASSVCLGVLVRVLRPRKAVPLLRSSASLLPSPLRLLPQSALPLAKARLQLVRAASKPLLHQQAQAPAPARVLLQPMMRRRRLCRARSGRRRDEPRAERCRQERLLCSTRTSRRRTAPTRLGTLGLWWPFHPHCCFRERLDRFSLSSDGACVCLSDVGASVIACSRTNTFRCVSLAVVPCLATNSRLTG